MGNKVKKFSFISVILSVICVVFVAEAAAPAAAIGNQQFFWWIFLIITFLLPYGMVVAELGTTYDSDGGLYAWIREAFGDRWGSRVAWYYWINFPLWIASLATLFPDILGMVFGVEFELAPVLLIELAFVWIVCAILESMSENRSKGAPSRGRRRYVQRPYDPMHSMSKSRRKSR